MFYSLKKKIGERLLKKIKKSKYANGYLLLKLINLADIKLDNEDKVHVRVDFVEKKKIDRLTLYSFDRPFQLIHADVGNLEFLGKMQQFLGMFYWWLTFILRRYMFIPCVQENKFYKK